jgi:hypothetical protein
MLPPLRETTKASDNADFGAHSRSFRTCSPTLRVSCCHSRARLASGWLAGLYREGVEPSGSLRKVSDHMVIPLSCPPDATHVPYESPVELRASYMPDAAWAIFISRTVVHRRYSWRCSCHTTHSGLRLITNDALRNVHSTWVLAVSDRTGFADRDLWNVPVLPGSVRLRARELHHICPLSRGSNK